MTETMAEGQTCLAWGDRDCWPFVRILIVAAALLSAGHFGLGWRIDLHYLLRVPGQVLGVLSVMAMISFVLAELYLLLFAVPLYVLGVLNDWAYSSSRWACRAVFRLRSAWLLALGGLLGEILLFSGLAYLVRRVLL